jgi:AraC-like DNA-binding protein
MESYYHGLETSSVPYKFNEPFKSQSLLEHVATAKDYIEEHLHERISLADLALQGGLSLYYFARRFKDVTGASPKQYILMKRLERAHLLLSQENVSVSEVAYQTGFTDQSHLVRYFKKYWGLTPKALRHTLGQETAPETSDLATPGLTLCTGSAASLPHTPLATPTFAREIV